MVCCICWFSCTIRSKFTGGLDNKTLEMISDGWESECSMLDVQPLSMVDMNNLCTAELFVYKVVMFG